MKLPHVILEKMNLIITYRDISQKIFENLIDEEDFLKCRLVSKSWKSVIDDPIFWLRNLKRIDQPLTAHNEWLFLIRKSIEFGKYETSLTLCIMRKYFYLLKPEDIVDEDTKSKWIRERKGLPAIYYAIQFGILEVVKLVHQVDNNFYKQSYKSFPFIDFTYPLIHAIQESQTRVAMYILSETKVRLHC